MYPGLGTDLLKNMRSVLHKTVQKKHLKLLIPLRIFHRLFPRKPESHSSEERQMLTRILLKLLGEKRSLAEETQASRRYSRATKPLSALHLATCQGQPFSFPAQMEKISGLLPGFEVRGRGGGRSEKGAVFRKCEERLTNVIGLLASSHGA